MNQVCDSFVDKPLLRQRGSISHCLRARYLSMDSIQTQASFRAFGFALLIIPSPFQNDPTGTHLLPHPAWTALRPSRDQCKDSLPA